MMIFSKKTLLFLLCCLMVSWGCRKNVTASQMDMAEYGWKLYSEVKYKKSNEWFVSAVFEDTTYKDGYNGTGWTYGKLGEIDSAIVSFLEGRKRALVDTTWRDQLLLTSDPPHDIFKEASAGLVFAFHAKGQQDTYSNAISYGDDFLNKVGDADYYPSKGTPQWTFSRDQTISSKHVIWTIASSHFALGNFRHSLNYIHRLMADSTTVEFTDRANPTVGEIQSLAAQLETLRSNL